jgi:ribose transport system ATP-binding protein
MQEPLLFLKNIHKRFPGVEALKGVDITLREGEVVSLAGSNGAGKSTLSNIIAGIYAPDEGEIFIQGNSVKIANPNVAKRLGIGIVHQEPTLVPNMSVLENIFLNQELTKNGLLDFKTMGAECEKIINMLGFSIDTNEKVEHLTLIEKEIVEIAKALLLDPKILILDEVTAPLNDDEVEHFFKIIEDIKSRGIGIVFIGHKIKEIIQIADSIVVFRDGKNVGELSTKDNICEDDIITLMLGENLQEIQDDLVDQKKETGANKEVLKTIKLTKNHVYEDIDLTVSEGEIVGFAGIKGSGITELFCSLQGIMGFDNGEVYVKGKRAKFRSPKDGMNAGIGMVTNDRQKEGLALDLNVKENITISSIKDLANRFRLVNNKKCGDSAKHYVESLSIKTPSINQLVHNLSGGNQQKIVIAKWFLKNLDIILIDEPTRGVDVGAKNEIYKILKQEKGIGKSILVTSPEIRELLIICDRIIIVVDGQIISEVQRNTEEFNEANILNVIHKTYQS